MFDDILKPNTQYFLGITIVFMLLVSIMLAFMLPLSMTQKIQGTFQVFSTSLMIYGIPIIFVAAIVQMSSKWPEGSKNNKN